MTNLNLFFETVGPETILVSSKKLLKMFYGYPFGGPMDIISYESANQILDNTKGTAAIECTIIPPRIVFEKDALISLTGADMSWRIGKQKVAMYKPLKIKAGQILNGKPSRNYVRSYIGIQGLTTTKNLPLRFAKNESYSLNRKAIIPKKRKKKIHDLQHFTSQEIHISKGPEWSYLDQASKEHLIQYKCKLNPMMNRIGGYLEGAALQIKYHPDHDSKCTFPGVIQLLPSGQLVILLNDGQITGGYPRVAYVEPSQLKMFNQILPGKSIYLTMI